MSNNSIETKRAEVERLYEKNKQLEAENRQLRLERDTLKKFKETQDVRVRDCKHGVYGGCDICIPKNLQR